MAEAVSPFHFPDDVWTRVIYDLVVAARQAGDRIEKYVAALVPIYFGRVGSFVIENRHLTTEQAEEHVERQAHAFELLKPYLVERWNANPRRPAGPPAAPSGESAEDEGEAGGPAREAIRAARATRNGPTNGSDAAG